MEQQKFPSTISRKRPVWCGWDLSIGRRALEDGLLLKGISRIDLSVFCSKNSKGKLRQLRATAAIVGQWIEARSL